MNRRAERGLLAVLIACVGLLAVAPAAAQEATPLPSVTLGDVADIPQSVSENGFPQLGQPDARVQITEYCAFGVEACAMFHESVFPVVLRRIADGDVRYTFIPVTSDADIPNAGGAARAALCAAEQGAFWTMSQRLFDWQREFVAEAFDSARLLGAVETLGLDRTRWDACTLSDRPDTRLDFADEMLTAQTGYTQAGGLPFVQINGVPSLPDAQSIQDTINLELSAPAADGAAEATEPPPVVTVEPLLGERIEPPLDITLPPGWQYGYDTLILNDADGAIRTVPLAVYVGPVSGGTGTIVLLWGFPSLIAGNPFLADSGSDVATGLWSDGLRLLRLAVLEQGCNIGTDLRTDYSIGGETASGTQFSAVDCPRLPDTRGWFAGVQQEGINFVFYVYTDPIDAMTGAEDELQAILDSVTFHLPEQVEGTTTPPP